MVKRNAAHNLLAVGMNCVHPKVINISLIQIQDTYFFNAEIRFSFELVCHVIAAISEWECADR